MVLIIVMSVVVCLVQNSTLMSSEPGIDNDFLAQDCSQLAQMPYQVLKKISVRLPSLKDVVHVRQTCKFFNKLFQTRNIKLGQLQHPKEDRGYWLRIYQQVAQLIVTVSSTQEGLVSLDLSGNKVTLFMFANHHQCVLVRKLRLVACGITSERENFFDPTVWTNLEKLDLSRNFLAFRDRDLSSSADWDSGADIWPSLCALPKLKKLILRENCLARIPQEIFKCGHLELLDMRGNRLRPEELEKLRQKLPHAVIHDNPQLDD
jgi:Leucine-rich repeat (LRR) protein